MAKASDNAFPSLLITEGSAPASPAAGKLRVYIDSVDHILKTKNSAGTVASVGAAAGDTSWTAPTLTGAWVNYGGSAQVAGYRKDSNGVVRIRGAIKTGTTGTSAFTLPAGYRPTGPATYAIMTANTGSTANVVGSAQVNTDGTVVISLAPSGASNAWVYLDGIAFYTD